MSTITIPKSVLQDIFDIATSSMDFGSGFLNDTEQDSLVEAALALGVDPMSAVQSQNRCAYRAKVLGVTGLVHDLCSWGPCFTGYGPNATKREARYCKDCAGAREERPVAAVAEVST